MDPPPDHHQLPYVFYLSFGLNLPSSVFMTVVASGKGNIGKVSDMSRRWQRLCVGGGGSGSEGVSVFLD